MSMSRYFKVGLFFIVLGSAGIIYILRSSDGFTNFNTNAYESTFRDAMGLSFHTKVYMAGVEVGKIRSIQLENNTALIRLALLKNIELRQDAVISRRASSILGTSVLSLHPGTITAPELLPGGTIQVEETMDMDAIMGSVSDLGLQLSGILAEFQQNHLALLAISLETFNSIASKFDARADEELEWISRILESAAYITERADWLLAEREEDINVSLLEMRLAMQNIRQLSDEIAQGRGNLGQAIYDDTLYTSLVSAVEQTEIAVVKLQDVLDGAGDFMGRVNSIGILVDSRANYGFNSGNVMAGASLRLEPASQDRWYRVGINGAPEGVSTRTVTTTSGTVTSYEDKTETKYTFSVDAELARRFGFVTIRGGLLESTAGFGVDIQPLRWAAVSGELFNFRRGYYPNLRAAVTLYPFFNPNANNPLNWIYLQGGVNDSLNVNRDFFIGGGLRFSDREIKSLVGLAASAAAVQ